MKKVVAFIGVAFHAIMSAFGASGDLADDAPEMPSASSYETTNIVKRTVTKTFLAADGKTVTGRYTYNLDLVPGVWKMTNEIICVYKTTLNESPVAEVPEGTVWVRTGPNAYENPKFAYMPKLILSDHGGISAIAADGKKYIAYGFRREERPDDRLFPFRGSGMMCSGPLFNSQAEIDRPNPHFRIVLEGVDDKDLAEILKTGNCSNLIERSNAKWRSIKERANRNRSSK